MSLEAWVRRGESVVGVLPWVLAFGGIAFGFAATVGGYVIAMDAYDQVEIAMGQQKQIAGQLEATLAILDNMKQSIIGPRTPVVVFPCVQPEPPMPPLVLGMGGS